MFTTLSTLGSLAPKKSGTPVNPLLVSLSFTASGPVENVSGKAFTTNGTMTYVNDSTRTSGGKYVASFNGSSSIFITPTFSMSGSTTLMFWSKGWSGGVALGGSSASGIWYVYNNGGVDCGGYLGEIYSASPLATLQGSGWVHWAYVRNNTTASATLYVNGTAVSVNSRAAYSTLSSPITSWSIGVGAGNGYGNYINSGARMDNIMVYNSALTQADVQAIYTSQL